MNTVIVRTQADSRFVTRLKHGHARRGRKHPLYSLWHAMITRCECAKSPKYALYGGRGIKVCKRWRESFAAFLADMGDRPSPQHQLDRIDNDGNYAPGNVRWATQAQQHQNRRCTRWVLLHGEAMPLTEAAERLGLRRATLARKLDLGIANRVGVVAFRKGTVLHEVDRFGRKVQP